MKSSLVLLISLLLFSCGTEPKVLGQKKDKEEKPSSQCPPSVVVPFHEIMVYFSAPPPPRISVIVEGEEELNECKAVVEKPPIVTIERFTGNILGILVQHYGAYPTLPRDVSFKIMDLGNCSGVATEFMKVEKAPLAFTTQYPHGPKCNPRTTARLKLKKE